LTVPEIRDIVKKSECKEGVVTVLSKHSTVSIMINEMEPRLVDDTRQFLSNLAPSAYPYLHNDLDYRSVLEDAIIESYCCDDYMSYMIIESYMSFDDGEWRR